MDQKNRTTWLAELEVGDEVALTRWGTGRFHYDIVKVSKISPSRKKISVASGSSSSLELNADGRTPHLKGRSGWGHIPTSIDPITPEILDSIKRGKLSRKMKAFTNESFLESIDLKVLEDAVTLLLPWYQNFKKEEEGKT